MHKYWHEPCWLIGSYLLECVEKWNLMLTYGVSCKSVFTFYCCDILFQKHYDEMNEMRTSESFLKEELMKKEDMLRRQADTILSQKSEIEHQRTVIESKGCSIL